MFNRCGIVSQEMFESLLPSKERREQGPYVIMECFQSIPCNPCNTSCSFGAVKFMEDINETPTVYSEKCTGCAVCVSVCPGLACFVIDETYSENEVSIKIPYEMTPLPEKGTETDALDRFGNVVGTAKVIQVQSNKKLDKTNIVTIAVPKELIYEVRSINVRG
ncbi:4Fe-4S dicluster domain-containing protein [Acidaminobacter hydrogenoformans]|uniref:4Fe-4S ferredoxin-type domain-containing protein n=1 Tax=Acidaminobacter hydrogenoformans DSM 2784 TaxID=1120920 RepID=A0A1G5S1K2_9FIRM|nr:4Fe-4S dicluster domain-containing protein [Acidaminobacter hydrogenoformans]SCZ80265.1 hypothetical protein SAMN03080599_02185 [Acidaminobacter hydrogenoformans DSM 2784]